MRIVPSVHGATKSRHATFKTSRLLRQVATYIVGVGLCCLLPIVGRAQTFGCSPAMANDIVCENSKTGTPESTWAISGDGDSSIQGFATDISVNRGQTISFKIKTNASAYHLDVYRLGYYGGNGARKIATVNPSASLPQNQPACLTNSATHLYDCGNWAVSASWAVPSNATSGVYFADAIRTDSGGTSQIFFIVRNDSSQSDVLYQTSDSSWQAYNAYGGNSLYGTTSSIWDAANRANKVSYNRPFNDIERITWVFGAEYPMIRWLEANGYDVTYFTDVDSDRNGSLIRNHKVYMSTGHDEYWSGGQRANVEAARDAGINLAFFSGNEVFWKTRWENSIDGSGTAYRTLVCYKETLARAKLDPLDPPTWTGTWRDPTFSPPGDGGRPENNLTGTIFMVNGPASDNNGLSIKVPAADGKMRFWRNTSIANLASGTATLPPATLGYEWDVADDNGFRPAGLFNLSTTTQNLTSSYLVDYGGVYGAGTATHHMTLYRAPSGALVFGAGTVQWSWGLDDAGGSTPSPDMRQATINLFADMGIQPATIQSGLLPATKSTDATPPGSTITSPTSGATVTVGVQITISGTASDGGGGVIGGVEVSVDGGITWHPASGSASWTYPFKPTQAGSYTLKSRAVDDSGNLETPGPGVTVFTGGGFSISGTISPSAAGSGATVTLGGTSSGTVTANSSGNYTFSGVFAGNYTVTPTKTGYTFSPITSAVAVTNANVSGVNFTGSQSSGTTYSISGSVTPAASGAGVTITLTGAATASTLTDSSGNFSVAGLANGTYIVTPSKLNFAFSPAQSSVTIASANVSGVTFAATATATAESLFTTQAPAEVGQSDGTNVNYELGTSFQSDTAGQVTAMRFWKDAKETGTHTGHIWSSAGALLASVTFAGETASGWQQQNLASPLSIAPSTTYVVSVNTGATYYVATTSGLASQIVNGNLHSVVGNNGVYGSPAQFPTNTYSSSNYFRDVSFLPGTTYSVSGTVSTNGSGATVTLSGTASASTIADGSGNYTFSGLANGSYTVSPSKSGFSFTPLNQAVIINSANMSGINFAASVSTGIIIDATVFGDRNTKASSVTSSAFSTTASNELLLAMVGADMGTSSGTNNSVSSVTGAGLTWVLVRRTNTQRGTAEIWRAFATAPLTNVTVTANLAKIEVSSITVMSFRGVNTSGTSGSGAIGNTGSGNGTTGTPTASLVTVGNNSLVVGAGEDWNAAPSVTAGPNQTLIHLWPMANLATFWTQRQNTTTPASGTSVTINDTVPTDHMYNLTICEVLAGP